MKNLNYNELSQSNNKVVSNGNTFLMAKKPFFTHANGVNVFKVLVVCVMRGKRIIYDRYTVTDAQNPFMILFGKVVPNPNHN